MGTANNIFLVLIGTHWYSLVLIYLSWYSVQVECGNNICKKLQKTGMQASLSHTYTHTYTYTHKLTHETTSIP